MQLDPSSMRAGHDACWQRPEHRVSKDNMINLSSRYAIKATMHLARSGAWVTAEELSTVTGIPLGYIAKVLQRLAGADLVRTQRGIHGGYHLARDAASITLWDIVHAIERPPLNHMCAHCAGCAGCGADRILETIDAEVVRMLRSHNLASMIESCTSG